MTRPQLLRRSLLGAIGGGLVLGRSALALAAANTEQRFVVVLLRGGMDGMSAVVPYGDKDLAALRAPLVPPPPGSPGGLLDLGGFFGLHPALAGLHGLFKAGEALPVHAVAGPYRARSHFEAQDFMEAGAPRRMTSGWLNRLAGTFHGRGSMDPAVALGAGVPLLLRGPIPVSNWAPPMWPSATQDLYARLLAVHRRDPITGPALTEGLKERGFTESVLAGTAPPPNSTGFALLADRAGRMLAAPDGPRLAALETEGWDTHGGQASRLTFELQRLDEGLMALRRGLGAVWQRTVVLVTTEFGRTAGINGSGGTDHGTASVAFVLGGGVAGGRVRADWPGLAPGRLFEDRDLQPTLDIRSLAKGIAQQHLGLTPAELADVFPGSETAAPLGGLMRT